MAGVGTLGIKADPLLGRYSILGHSCVVAGQYAGQFILGLQKYSLNKCTNKWMNDSMAH